MSPVRILHLVSHPIQYFAPLYREIATRSDVDLTVVFYSDASVGEFHDADFGTRIEWKTDLLGGYRSVIPAGSRGRPAPRRFLSKPNWDVLKTVALADYDVIWIHGYAHLTAWLAWLIASARRKSFILREEQTLLRRRRWDKRLAKMLVLRALLRRSFGLYIGEHSRRYLAHYGVRGERLFPARYCVDNDTFRRRARELQPARSEIRGRLGIGDDAPAILFCGKLVENKGLRVLIRAFSELRKHQPCWLVVVGDGRLREDLTEEVTTLGINGVVFAGFLDQVGIASAYAAADVFVLPSFGETWGLVVNEALNFSLPVVVSDAVGCAPDLVRDGWNGFVVPAGNADALSDALQRLVQDSELRETFGERGRALVDSYSIESCADGVVSAAVAAARVPAQAQVVGA